MRRGIDIRKKKRLIIKDSNKKALHLLLILFAALILCVIIYTFFIQNLFIKKNFEKHNINFSNLNENVPFSLNKIILFSSATAETNTINQSVALNISNYCDIGIYINNLDKENNYIKSLYINNIEISTPKAGTPHLYKKNVKDLGKCSFNKNNIIQDDFYFNIIEKNSEINYDNYEMYNTGSTPISLGFYNENIKKEFFIDNSEIEYNGTLLKKALIPQSNINCTVSFTINIITNLDEQYVCNVNFDIPFQDEKESVYDNGYITKEIDTKQLSAFVRTK